jgi:uncharacterized protein with ParB-like and HNH nuclease domain
MNSTGLELSQADLIRNFILDGLGAQAADRAVQELLAPDGDGRFGQAAYVVHFDAFMRHYLTAKTGEIPNVREVYAAFKTFARGKATRASWWQISTLRVLLLRHGAGQKRTPRLKQAFHDLRELKVDVAYPFLLDAYHDYKHDRLTADELLSIVRLVESYVFRRAICAIPTNSLNKTFAGLSRTPEEGPLP